MAALQVPAVQGRPGEAGQQAGEQLLAAHRVHVGAPHERPRHQVRSLQRFACLHLMPATLGHAMSALSSLVPARNPLAPSTC